MSLQKSKSYEQNIGGFRKYKDKRTTAQKVQAMELFRDVNEEYRKEGKQLEYKGEGKGFKIIDLKTINK